MDEDEEVLDVLVGERAAEQQLVQDLDERHEEVLVAAPDRVAVVQLVHLVNRKKMGSKCATMTAFWSTPPPSTVTT